MKIWVGDGLWEEDEARISPFDHAIITGDGVFETLKVTAGRPCAVRRHTERLARSAAGLRLRVPDDETLRRALDDVVTGNGLALAVSSRSVRRFLSGATGEVEQDNLRWI